MSQKKKSARKGSRFFGLFRPPPPRKKKRSVSVEKNDDVFDDVAEPGTTELTSRHVHHRQILPDPPTTSWRRGFWKVEKWRPLQPNWFKQSSFFLPNWFSLITKHIQNLHHIFMNLQKKLKSTTLEDLNPYKPTKKKLLEILPTPTPGTPPLIFHLNHMSRVGSSRFLQKMYGIISMPYRHMKFPKHCGAFRVIHPCTTSVPTKGLLYISRRKFMIHAISEAIFSYFMTLLSTSCLEKKKRGQKFSNREGVQPPLRLCFSRGLHMSNHFNETSQRFFKNSDINYRSAWVYFPKIQKFKFKPFFFLGLFWVGISLRILPPTSIWLCGLGSRNSHESYPSKKKINLKLPWYSGIREML